MIYMFYLGHPITRDDLSQAKIEHDKQIFIERVSKVFFLNW